MADIDRLFAALLLILGLTLSYAGGSWTAYVIIAVTLLISAKALATKSAGSWLSGEPAVLCFVAGFVIIAIAFSFTAKGPQDMISALNFTMFLLFAPLRVFFGKFSSAKSTIIVAEMALAGCFLAMAIACYQVFIEGMERASSFGSDPIWSAQTVIIVGFIALIGFNATDRAWRHIFLLGPILATAVTLLSGSRGPLLAVPILLVHFVLLSSRRWWIGLGMPALLLGIVAIPLVAFWPPASQRLMTLYTVIADMFSGSSITEGSAGVRQMMYGASFQAFLASPWVGYGWEHKLPAIAPYLPNGLASFELVHHHLHSDILDFGVSAGVLGIVAYLMIIAAPILGCFFSPRDSQFRFRLMAISFLSVGYLIFGGTYLLFGYEYHTTLYVCLSAIILGYCQDSPSLV